MKPLTLRNTRTSMKNKPNSDYAPLLAVILAFTITLIAHEFFKPKSPKVAATRATLKESLVQFVGYH